MTAPVRIEKKKNTQIDYSLTESYDYILDESLIAKEPVSPRDHSRLMVVRRIFDSASETSKTPDSITAIDIEHRSFYELPTILPRGSIVIGNRSKVIPARFRGTRILDTGIGGKVEVLLLKNLAEDSDSTLWQAIMASSAKQNVGLRVHLGVSAKTKKPLTAEIVDRFQRDNTGVVVLKFSEDPVQSGLGHLPLPHYMEKSEPTAFDEERYQTVFAKEAGSAAAPTAGLHFTDQTFAQLKDRGIAFETILLHVGIGTFRPVQSAHITQHAMHEEEYFISADVVEKVEAAKARSAKVIAVGTTSVRTLESAIDRETKKIRSGPGQTSIFLHPLANHEYQVLDGLITNFHLPKSSLIMLVASLLGPELTLEAYKLAVKERYRFFSYGDAMLIL